MSQERSYDPLYIEFIHYFNVERDYFECHEVMEELWLEEGRNPLYQGLLQAAVGLYHFRNNNISGAIKLFTGGIEKMRLFPEHNLGIDLEKLIHECERYVEKLHEFDSNPFEFYDLDIMITDPALEKLVAKIEKGHRQ